MAFVKWNYPTNDELNNLWKNLKLEKINNLTQSTNKLIDRINNLYVNGGIRINKYRISENNSHNYYIIKDKNFVQKISENKIILNDRKYLELDGELPKIIIKDYFTDIYTLSGNLARIIGYGGAYKKEPVENHAWEIANDFVKNEFENRFEENDCYIIKIENAKWFYDVAWDYSFIIADIEKYEIIFIDITDTD